MGSSGDLGDAEGPGGPRGALGPPAHELAQAGWPPASLAPASSPPLPPCPLPSPAARSPSPTGPGQAAPALALAAAERSARSPLPVRLRSRLPWRFEDAGNPHQTPAFRARIPPTETPPTNPVVEKPLDYIWGLLKTIIPLPLCGRTPSCHISPRPFSSSSRTFSCDLALRVKYTTRLLP